MAERPAALAAIGAGLRAAARSLAGAPPPSPAGDALVAHCLQCGRDRTDVIRRVRGRLHVSCRACGAITVQDASRLRSRAELRAADAAAAVADRQPQPHPLAPYVSAELLEWACEAGRDRRVDQLDKPTIYRLWKEFDRRDPAAGAALPSFGEVAGVLQASCYDEGVAVRELLGADPDPGRAAAIAERAACARRWLAGPGREHAWISKRAADEPVDLDAARSLLHDGVLDGKLDGARREALYGAIFGTAGGPPTRAIVQRFDAATIAAAVAAHLEDGSHPLRGAVLAALDGRGVPEPAGPEVAVPC